MEKSELYPDLALMRLLFFIIKQYKGKEEKYYNISNEVSILMTNQLPRYTLNTGIWLQRSRDRMYSFCYYMTQVK
jgi:hypothetical protein